MREISDWNELQQIVNSNSVVFLDVYATWCGPCKKIGPVFEILAEDNEDAVFVKTNCSDSQDIAHKLNVSSIPTIIAFVDGKEVDRMMGANVDKLNAFVRQYV